MSETQKSVQEMSSPQGNDGSGQGMGLNNIDFIMDIPLEVTVRLGRARLPISELIELGAGSVIELDRVAGEPLEVLVNNKLVARGEAVVISDKFGVRLTEIVSPTEKILDLKG
jgi:flagellar motor switch protein FliN/FliY